MFGTFVNILAVLAGGTLGLLIKKKLPERYTDIVFYSIGLFTLYLGLKMTFESQNPLILIFSLIIGSILGEWIDLDARMNTLGEYLKKKMKLRTERFSEGLVTAFMIYCMGSLTVLGSIEEGLGKYPNLLLTKSVLDGFASVALASAMGAGVLFSVVPLFFFQGGITLLTYYFGEYFSATIVAELTAVGGLILIGLAFGLLNIKKIKVINMLPSLLVVILLVLLHDYLF